jgi:hypothetical protein
MTGSLVSPGQPRWPSGIHTAEAVTDKERPILASPVDAGRLLDTETRCPHSSRRIIGPAKPPDDLNCLGAAPLASIHALHRRQSPRRHLGKSLRPRCYGRPPHIIALAAMRASLTSPWEMGRQGSCLFPVREVLSLADPPCPTDRASVRSRARALLTRCAGPPAFTIPGSEARNGCLRSVAVWLAVRELLRCRRGGGVRTICSQRHAGLEPHRDHESAGRSRDLDPHVRLCLSGHG